MSKIPELNKYWNFASSAAFAFAQEASVEMRGRLNAGGDGVVGVSTATARALGGNNPIDMKRAMEAYESDQWQGMNGMFKLPPSAFAVAIADKVNIVTEGDIVAGGNGVYAMSYARAKAAADDGNSVAIAKADDVNVTVNGDVTAGKTGVYAGSVADANANEGKGFELERARQCHGQGQEGHRDRRQRLLRHRRRWR